MLCSTESCSVSFERKMKERGMRITPQKRAIYEALCGCSSHPTAEELYQKVHSAFPNMSFATVYDNLRKFVASGVCRELYFDAGTARFDANVEPHHHILDSASGKILDVCVDVSHVPVPEELKDKVIKEIRITYIT